MLAQEMILAFKGNTCDISRGVRLETIEKLVEDGMIKFIFFTDKNSVTSST
jgi:hypothetical protein